MKVLYVNQTGQLGGGEIALLPWLEHTAADARIVLFEDGPFRPALEKAAVTVDVLSLGSVKSVRRESGLGSIVKTIPDLLKLRRRLRKLIAGAPILYANSQKAFFLTALSKSRKQKLVWHLRDIMTGEHFSLLMRRVAVALGNRYATVIIANSRASADAYVAAGGAPGKVKVVHDGVSSRPFDEMADRQEFAENLRRKLGVSASTPLVGVFGRLSEWKGQMVLLEAIAQLPNAHAVLIGDALFGEDNYVDKLRARAEKPDLANRVHFLGFRRDIPALMQAVTIIAHTSIAPEPFGLVIVEGMLAERPVIATRAGGALEIVEDGSSGLLVTPGDAGELRTALALLISDPDRMRHMGENGRRRAQSAFSTAILFRELTGILEGISS